MLPFREPSATRKLALYPETGHPLSASMLRTIRALVGRSRPGEPRELVTAELVGSALRADRQTLYANTVPVVTHDRPLKATVDTAPLPVCHHREKPRLPRRFASRSGDVATSLRAKRGNPTHLSQNIGKMSYMRFHFGSFRNAAKKRFRHMFYAVRFRCGTKVRTCVGINRSDKSYPNFLVAHFRGRNVEKSFK